MNGLACLPALRLQAVKIQCVCVTEVRYYKMARTNDYSMRVLVQRGFCSNARDETEYNYVHDRLFKNFSKYNLGKISAASSQSVYAAKLNPNAAQPNMSTRLQRQRNGLIKYTRPRSKGHKFAKGERLFMDDNNDCASYAFLPSGSSINSTSLGRTKLTRDKKMRGTIPTGTGGYVCKPRAGVGSLVKDLVRYKGYQGQQWYDSRLRSADPYIKADVMTYKMLNNERAGKFVLSKSKKYFVPAALSAHNVAQQRNYIRDAKTQALTTYVAGDAINTPATNLTALTTSVGQSIRDRGLALADAAVTTANLMDAAVQALPVAAVPVAAGGAGVPVAAAPLPNFA